MRSCPFAARAFVESGVEALVGQHVGLAEYRSGFGRGLRAGFRIEVEDRDFRARLAQRPDRRQPEPRSPAGHHCGNG